MMHTLKFVLLLAPTVANALNVVLSNDDGWAEKNIRVLYDSLDASGLNVLISAPAVDRSGTGMSLPRCCLASHRMRYMQLEEATGIVSR
jgi:5'/3'-nucleotidase SurE